MEKIGKYAVVRKLGAGGMGVVFEARDPTLDRAVAIKLLNDRADPERFKREAKLAARVGHANCVPIYHADEHDGQFYVVMELVVGQNASQYLDRHRPIPWQTATKLVIAAGRGLAAVHDAGLIHRDIAVEHSDLEGRRGEADRLRPRAVGREGRPIADRRQRRRHPTT